MKKHLKENEILEIASGAIGPVKKAMAGVHIKSCKECAKKIEDEIAFREKVAEKLDKVASATTHSRMMDVRVLREIEVISKSKAPQRHPKWAVAVSLVCSVLFFVYGFFFYAPVFGAAKETPAQAIVSGSFYPVIGQAGQLVPKHLDRMGNTYEKMAFFNILCDKYGVCEADRIKLVYQSGFDYKNVFVSSMLGMALDLNSEDVLNLISNGKTPGQVLSKLGVPFTSQLSAAGEFQNQVNVTKADLATRDTISFDVLKVGKKITSPFPVNIPEGGKDGHYIVRMDKNGKIISASPSKENAIWSGMIESAAFEKNEFVIKLDDGTLATVKISYETTLKRYDDPILPNQLSAGQIVKAQGILSGKTLLAIIVDVREQDQKVSFKGLVADLDKSNVAINGFGSALYLNPKTIYKGKPSIGETVEVEAIGNDITGYKVISMVVIPKPPQEKPVEKITVKSGIVVNVTTDEGGRRIFLLSDGTLVYYSRNTVFEGEKLSTGTVVAVKGVMDSEKQMDARTVNVKNQAVTQTFSIAGELVDIRCITSCNWVKAEGVSEITVKGVTSPFLIYPETVGHSVVTPSRKGQIVILEGRTIAGVMLVDRAQVTDPTTQIIRTGIIVKMDQKEFMLDDGSIFTLKSYTSKADGAAIGSTVSVTCMESDGSLIALKVELKEAEPEITSWLTVVSFENGELVLEDGTRFLVNGDTKIWIGIAKEKGTPDMLVQGAKVACTYRKGQNNIALEILVQKQ